MPFLTEVLLTGCWIAIGLFIGRRSRRTGTAILWAVVLGPLGLLLFAYGEWSRGSLPSQASSPAASATQNLELPLEVLIDGRWHPGRLQAWAVDEKGWRGCVEYLIDGVGEAAWFGDHELRKAPI